MKYLICLFAAGVVTIGLGTSLPAAEDSSKPNVIVILADDKYYSAVRGSCYYREHAIFIDKTPLLRIALDCGRFSPIQ